MAVQHWWIQHGSDCEPRDPNLSRCPENGAERRGRQSTATRPNRVSVRHWLWLLASVPLSTPAQRQRSSVRLSVRSPACSLALDPLCLLAYLRSTTPPPSIASSSSSSSSSLPASVGRARGWGQIAKQRERERRETRNTEGPAYIFRKRKPAGRNAVESWRNRWKPGGGGGVREETEKDNRGKLR